MSFAYIIRLMYGVSPIDEGIGSDGRGSRRGLLTPFDRWEGGRGEGAEEDVIDREKRN